MRAVTIVRPTGHRPRRAAGALPGRLLRRPPLVAVLGVDGAGKSTQARLLARWLDDQGIPASAFKNPGGRVALARLARRLGRRDAEDLFGRGFVAVESAVRWTVIGRALLLSRVTGRVAVMDRYVYCQYAAIRARGDAGERWARVAFGVFPEPEVVCLLSVPAEVARERVERRGRDTEELAYLARFDAAYRSLPEAPTFRTVDGDATPGAVQAALRDTVMPYLRPTP